MLFSFYTRLSNWLESILIEKLGSFSFSCSMLYNFIEKPFSLFAGTHVRTTTGGKIACYHFMVGKQSGIPPVAYHKICNCFPDFWLAVFSIAWDKQCYAKVLVTLQVSCHNSDIHFGLETFKLMFSQIN